MDVVTFAGDGCRGVVHQGDGAEAVLGVVGQQVEIAACQARGDVAVGVVAGPDIALGGGYMGVIAIIVVVEAIRSEVRLTLAREVAVGVVGVGFAVVSRPVTVDRGRYHAPSFVVGPGCQTHIAAIQRCAPALAIALLTAIPLCVIVVSGTPLQGSLAIGAAVLVFSHIQQAIEFIIGISGEGGVMA